MATYRGTFPAGEATRLNASQRVRQHATLCSVPYLTYIVKTGVTEIDKPAPSAAGIPATTSAPAPAAAAPAFGFQPPQAAPRGPIDAGGARYSTQQRISGQPVGAK